MKIHESELLLLKRISKTHPIEFNIKITGNLRITQHCTYENEHYISLCIAKGNIHIHTTLFTDYLVNAVGLSKSSIQSLCWCSYLNFNCCEVSTYNKNTMTKQTPTTREDLFGITFEVIRTKTLTIIYKSKGLIYSNLYFKYDNLYYSEYVIKDSKTKVVNKILVNRATLTEIEERIRDLIILDVAPNYETPTPNAYKYQLYNYSKRTGVRIVTEKW